jgi:hypothetical protein
MSIRVVAPLVLTVVLLASCASPAPTSPSPGDEELSTVFYLPDEEGSWSFPGRHSGALPSANGTVEIRGIGEFPFAAAEVETLRPDIFRPGHFSLFDILVHLDGQGTIDLTYHFDESLDTHVIDAINGEENWWYEVKYPGGWFEPTVFRMDMYPYKDGTELRMYHKEASYINGVNQTYADEVVRLNQNEGRVVIPDVRIGHQQFKDVEVTAHNIRSDMLQPGVVTALDLLLSLGEQGRLSRLKITWYESIAEDADPVDDYFVELIDFGDGLSDDEAFGRCGWVYETGPEVFSGFSGSHIHIPSDVRVAVSPEYALWFWLCI